MFASVEIFNVENGESHIVLETDTHVEAPNWTSDGKALILNGEGRLYRLELDAPTLQLIDTGELEWLNNDHGISPDGQTIVVSDSPRRGTSIIYTLPVEGGTPDRVTEHAPSWWHGWSPDGAILAYTCVRNKHFGVAVCPAKGGLETVLISSPHHYDGPDYTPDGEWIWFNSDRSGCMDLWRMRADGSNPERMTQGDSVDWFPHPSPDGKHVCYLAYPAGTTGHPFGRDVELRLIPSAGGTPRTLLGLFGGQGTINVPSWAPNSRSFAFVRYSASRSYGLN